GDALDVNLGVASVSASGGTLGLNGLDAALDEAGTTLLAEPLTDANGIVSINLNDGTLEIDLEKLAENSEGSGLNGLPADTELLTAESIQRITGAVAEALGTVTEKATTVLTDVLNNVGVEIA